tara:strand:- start:5058 stop:5798 length:741 start_codon:yes stop_codon:yes gene_type:complete
MSNLSANASFHCSGFYDNRKPHNTRFSRFNCLNVFWLTSILRIELQFTLIRHDYSSQEKQMKHFIATTLAVVMIASTAFAAEVKSGLQAGADIGAFYVTKVAGADDDGVKTKANLCYRCKNGKRPQVMVFTRSSDDKVVNLIDQLDAAITKNEAKQLRAFVNVLGDSRSVANKGVKSIASASKAKHVPFVLPNEYENGPDNYQLNPEAEVTILICNNHKVVSSHAVASAKELDVKKILESVTSSLK